MRRTKTRAVNNMGLTNKCISLRHIFAYSIPFHALTSSPSLHSLQAARWWGKSHGTQQLGLWSMKVLKVFDTSEGGT